MANVTMEQMLEKMKEIEKLMAEAASDPDPDKVTAVAARAEAAGRELEAMGKAYVEEQRTAATGRHGVTEVVLTPEQRKNIHQKTGIHMETLRLSDDDGTYAKVMPQQDPRVIEQLALREAERRKQAEEAEEIMRRELKRVIADLEDQNNPDVQAELDKLRADPNFAGGMLHKK